MFVDVCGICYLFLRFVPSVSDNVTLVATRLLDYPAKEFIGPNMPKWPVTSYYITFSIYSTLYCVTAYDSMWCYIIL